MEFEENLLINDILEEYKNTFSLLLDTDDIFGESILGNIDKFLSNSMFRKFKQIKIFYWLRLKDMGVSLGFWKNIQIWSSGLKPLYVAAKNGFNPIEKKKKKKEKKVEKCDKGIPLDKQ